MSTSLADCLEVWGFEKDFIIFSDGSLGLGFELTPLDVSCFDDDKLNQFSDHCTQFLNGLPPNLDLQFVQDVKGGNHELIEKHISLAAKSDDVSHTLTSMRADRLKNFDAHGSLPFHGLYVFVRVPFIERLVEKPKLFSRPKRFESVASHQLERELNSAQKLKDELKTSLGHLGFAISDLAANQIAEFLYDQWNPGSPLKFNGFDPEDVRSSLLYSDVNLSETGFSIGEVHHRIVSLKTLPEQTYSAMAQTLRSLPFDSKLFLTIHVPDQQKEIETLQTQRRIAFSMARGKKQGVSDIESEAKFQDLETILEEMIARGEKVFHFSLNVLLRSKDPEQLGSQVAQTLMTIRELSGAEGMAESLASFDVFSELAIPNARSKERARKIKSSNLADLLPIYGPWRGHPGTSLLLRSRHGSLVSIDPFSPDLTNYNQIVSGGSGSGKSFLSNILLLQMLKESPRVFIVDIGGSYKKLSENLNGQYIQLSLDSNISINPFDLAANEAAPSSSKIKFLVGLVEMMTKEDDQASLHKLERAQLEEAIQKVYDNTTNPSLADLRRILTDHTDNEMKRLARILTAWCGDSAFGRFVDRQTSVMLKRPIVCFDLKGMEDYPDLQAVCLYIITDLVWREVQTNRNQKKFLIFDECWKLLENDAGSQFIAEVFRTFRKYYASAVAISQNIDDFAKSKVATAILSNSAIKWILIQRGADQARLKEVLQLNDREMALVSSLRQERGVFSEAFLIAGENRSVVAIESTPLEYWIATTDPRDLAKLPNNTSFEELKKIAVQFPIGVANAGADL